jgi:flagellar protein FliO/FliZ
LSAARRALLAAASLAVALALPGSAFALTNKQFQNIASTRPSGEGTPHVGLDAGGAMIRALIGFVVVIGVILVIAKMLKANQRRQQGLGPRKRGQATGIVEVLSSTPLGPNRHLHMVRVGNEVILVGAGEGGITPIRTYDETQAISLGALETEEQVIEGTFADALSAAGAPAPRRAPSPRMLDRVRDLTSR